MSVNDFLHDVWSEFNEHMKRYRENGDLPFPSLTNDVHPMFRIDRWVTGKGQNIRDLYENMRPALQLASLWLTEDAPLLWFSRLTFGNIYVNSTGQSYIARNSCIEIDSQHALEIVKANLHEFGKVNCFMFAPHSYKGSQWGTTYSRKECLPYFEEFSNRDFPAVLSKEGRSSTCISLARGFARFFRMSTAVSERECCRGCFMFATVIVHEIVHGYYMFIKGVCDEPLWDQNEKHAELGFSWEATILGHIPMPSDNDASVNGQFHEISAMQLREYPANADYERIMRRLKSGSHAEFTTRDAKGNHRVWPVLSGGEFRGAKWALGNDAQLFVASIHVIPLSWIVAWFRKDTWARLKTWWSNAKMYRYPYLGNSFMIIYERTPDGVRVHRPLCEDDPVDAEILKERRNLRRSSRSLRKHSQKE
ncbi:thiamine pyrophosphate enzyme [Pyrenophora seminiperda CCB06]|uniref:Thiamine pyrophosphate enzyme n=1 Tax=Pyrenophora seminiperda CCB06 TaxID=1302712 RepID=A0A3M7LVQ1_9PLEO|nr:thiamine pyrophosphate enzyme [Pyrenophora seminiperda CCB06]